MNDMATAGEFAEFRSIVPATSKSKNAAASVKARSSKRPFSTCETIVDFPQPDFPRYQRISLVSPEAHFTYSGLSKMGIGSVIFIVFKHKVDFAFKRSTRLLLIVIAKK